MLELHVGTIFRVQRPVCMHWMLRYHPAATFFCIMRLLSVGTYGPGQGLSVCTACPAGNCSLFIDLPHVNLSVASALTVVCAFAVCFQRHVQRSYWTKFMRTMRRGHVWRKSKCVSVHVCVSVCVISLLILLYAQICKPALRVRCVFVSIVDFDA